MTLELRPPEAPAEVAAAPAGRRSRPRRRGAPGRTAMVIAAGYLVLLALAAVFAHWVAPHDPYAQDLNAINGGPSAAHWLGQDDVGRDVLSRLIYGARVSLASSLLAVGLSLLLAVPVGLASGFFGGIVDNVAMRVVDGVQSIPPLVLALTIAGLLGPSLRNIVIALAIIFAPTFIRLIRGQTLAIREETFVEASRSIGSSPAWIIRRRILPNVASPLIVQASISLGFGLLAEAGLSFLGLGIQPPEASWGVMLNRAYASLFTDGWAVLPPGFAIMLTVLAFNVLGDGLRDRLGRRV